MSSFNSSSSSLSFSVSQRDRFLRFEQSLLCGGDSSVEVSVDGLGGVIGGGDGRLMVGRGGEGFDLDSSSRFDGPSRSRSMASGPSGFGDVTVASYTALTTDGTGTDQPTPVRLGRLTLALAFLGCGACSGSSFFMIHKCLVALDPLSLALVRCALVFAFLSLVQFGIMYLPFIGTSEGRVRQRREFVITFTTRSSLCHMAVFGLLFSAASSALVGIGELHVSSGVTAVVMMIEPLIAPCLASIFLRRRRWLGASVWGPKEADSLATGVGEPPPVNTLATIGLLLGLAGTAVSAIPTSHDADVSDVLSLVACVGASLCGATGVVLGQHFADPRPVLHRLLGQMLFGAIFLLPVTCLLRVDGVFPAWDRDTVSPLPDASLSTWLWILALSFGPTVGAWSLFYLLLRELGALASTVHFLIPPVSMVLGAVFASEWSDFNWSDITLELGGMLLTLLGVACVLYAAHRHERARADTRENSLVSSINAADRETRR